MSVPTYLNTIDFNSFIPGFLSTYAGAVGGLYANDIATTFPVDSLIGVYPYLADSSGMSKWVDGAGRKLAKPLGAKISITSSVFEDSQTYPVSQFNTTSAVLFNNKITSMAKKAAWHRNWMLGDFIRTAHAVESYDSRWNGPAGTVVNFFDSNHPIGFDNNGANPTGTQTNRIDSNEMASLNVANPLAPTPAEAAQIIQDLTAKLYSMTDLAGSQINGDMKSIYIFVATVAHYTAFKAATVNQTILSGSAAITNPVIAFEQDGINFRVIFDQRFQSEEDPSYGNDQVIYACRADGDVKPFILQETEGLSYQILDGNSEYARLNNYVVFGVKETLGVGPGMYQSALRMTLN